MSGVGPAIPPVATVPVAAVPVAAVPVAAVPVDAVPIAAVPVAAIPVDAVPVAAVPIEAIPAAVRIGTGVGVDVIYDPGTVQIHYSVLLVRIVLMMLFNQCNVDVLSVKCSVCKLNIGGYPTFAVTFEKDGIVFKFNVKIPGKILCDVTISHVLPRESRGNSFMMWVKTLGVILPRHWCRVVRPRSLFANEQISDEHADMIDEFYKLVDALPDCRDTLPKLLDDMCLLMKSKMISSKRVFTDEFIAMVETIIATLSLV